MPGTNVDTITVNTTTAVAVDLTVDGGGVAIAGNANPGLAATLTVNGPAFFAAGTTLTMGQNATLVTGGGSIDSLSTAGNATLDTDGRTDLTTYTDGGTAGTFTKQGRGALLLDNVTATQTHFVVEGGTLDATGTSGLGGAPQVTLAGGHLAVKGQAAVGPLSDALAEQWYDVTGNFMLLWPPIDSGGGLLTLTPDATTFLRDGLDFDIGKMYARSGRVTGIEDFGVAWLGQITIGGDSPLTAGDITFGTQSSDGSTLSIDLNGDNDFGDPGEEIVSNNFDHGKQPKVGDVNLADGTYDIVVGMYDKPLPGMGYALIDVRFAQGGIAVPPTSQAEHLAIFDTLTRVAPGSLTQSGLWSTGATGVSYLGPLAMTGVAVNVTADSTLDAETDRGADFGSLELFGGVLTTSGAYEGISFTGTTIDGAATSVGFKTLAGTNLGPVVGNSATVTITKSGSADLVLNQTNSGLDNATFVVEQGRLIGARGSPNPFGAAGIRLAGGELVLSSKTGGDVPFDNALTVETSSTVTAGAAGGGLPGPLTVTLGSETNGATVQSGTLKLKTTDQYHLLVAGNVTAPPGAGEIRLDEGTVTLARGASVDAAEIKGGTLNAGADILVETMEISAGTVNTNVNQVIVGESLKLGPITFSIAGAPSFAASGSDLLAGGDMDIDGGTLTVSSGTIPVLEVLLVAGSNPPGPGDQSVYDRLTGVLGHNVTVVAGWLSVPGDAAGMDLVLVSSDNSSSDVNTKFTDMDPTFAPMGIPTINWENALVDDYRFADRGKELKEPALPDTITIIEPDHPMAAGLSGDVWVSTPDPFQTVRVADLEHPAPGGVSIAYPVAAGVPYPEYSALFVVDEGGELNNGVLTSARRLQFFCSDVGLTLMIATTWA